MKKLGFFAAIGVVALALPVPAAWAAEPQFEHVMNIGTAGALRPDVAGKPRRLYSFGEAVGPDNQPLRDAARPAGQSAAPNLAPNVSWGGSTILCTRNSRFELSDHKDCGSNGLTATGFATVELSPTGATTVQFK